MKVICNNLKIHYNILWGLSLNNSKTDSISNYNIDLNLNLNKKIKSHIKSNTKKEKNLNLTELDIYNDDYFKKLFIKWICVVFKNKNKLIQFEKLIVNKSLGIYKKLHKN